MGAKGGSFGMVILLVVMAIALLLVASAWKRVAPTAIEVSGRPGVAVPDHGQPAAAAATRSGELPDLEQTRNKTDAHVGELQEALAGIE